MSTLLENQSFKKKIAFVKTDDAEKKVTFLISINCNHDIDKGILTDIESVVNEMFLENYEDSDVYEQRKKLEKITAKNEKEKEKIKNKEQLNQKKKHDEAQKKYEEDQQRYEKMIAEKYQQRSQNKSKKK
jgi:hypothetical protein